MSWAKLRGQPFTTPGSQVNSRRFFALPRRVLLVVAQRDSARPACRGWLNSRQSPLRRRRAARTNAPLLSLNALARDRSRERRALPRRSCPLCRFYVKKLMGGDVLDGVGRLEQSPDAAGEVALEAADRFAGALAFAASAGDVVAGRLVAAGAGDDHAVQRRVDLAVAALVEPLALRVARAGGDRRDAGRAGQLGRVSRSAARRRSRRRAWRRSAARTPAR